MLSSINRFYSLPLTAPKEKKKSKLFKLLFKHATVDIDRHFVHTSKFLTLSFRDRENDTQKGARQEKVRYFQCIHKKCAGEFSKTE